MKKKVYLVWGMYIGDSANYGSDQLNDVWHMGLFADYDKAVKVAEGLEKVEKHFWSFYDINKYHYSAFNFRYEKSV